MRPTIKQVNLLFLIVLLLQASNLWFTWLPQYVRLILNQACFILLPTLIYMRWAGLPIRQTVGWRWPGGTTSVLSLLIGVGLYPTAVYIAATFQTMFGYSLPEVPGMLPANQMEALLALIALAVMAPICEEFLFRGVLQNAYAHHGPARTILFVGFLFSAFHLSLLQGLSIIPLSLALGFVYWRTGSLPAAILTHAGANVAAALVLTSGVWLSGAGAFLLAPATAITGLMIAALALGILTYRTTPAPTPDRPIPTGNRWAQNWPLLAALPLLLLVIGLEVLLSRSPELLAEPIALNDVPWDAPQSWRYEISNIIDEPIGHAVCALTPEREIIRLVCEQDQVGYEVRQGQSYWSSIDFVGQRTVEWRREDYAPLTDVSEHTLRNMHWSITGQTVTVEISDPGMETRRSEQALPPLARGGLVTSGGSWPWQLAALTFEAGATARLTHVAPDVWRPATQDMGPVVQTAVVRIVGIEEIETPAGRVEAWRVEVGKREAAWYDTSVHPILLRYFNGMETWTLLQP